MSIAALFKNSSKLEMTQLTINRKIFGYIHAVKNDVGLEKEPSPIISKNTEE